MNSFFYHAIHKIKDLQANYPNRQPYAAYKLAKWSFKQYVRRQLSSKKTNRKQQNISCWYTLFSEIGEEQVSPHCSKTIPFLPQGWHIRFDIAKALELFPQTKRLGLIFFMGIGDYFYSTNFIEQLHKQFPSLAFDAYVSETFDANNSPLVAQCLTQNPYIDRIILYPGKNARPELWKNYDYSQCYKLASDDTLLLPMIYEYEPYVLSRTFTLCDTFNLPIPNTNIKPIIYNYPPTEQVLNLFNQYKSEMNKVVFVQGSNRSSNFCYPFHDELVKKLLDLGFFVITVEKTELKSPRLLTIDIKKFKITESISLIQQIHNAHIPLYMITTFSCFNSIASGLNIPTLSMQCFYDVCMSSVIFSNIWLITPKYYEQVLTDKQFIATPDVVDYVNEKYIYHPEFVIKCFEQIITN